MVWIWIFRRCASGGIFLCLRLWYIILTVKPNVGGVSTVFYKLSHSYITLFFATFNWVSSSNHVHRCSYPVHCAGTILARLHVRWSLKQVLLFRRLILERVTNSHSRRSWPLGGITQQANPFKKSPCVLSHSWCGDSVRFVQPEEKKKILLEIIWGNHNFRRLLGWGGFFFKVMSVHRGGPVGESRLAGPGRACRPPCPPNQVLYYQDQDIQTGQYRSQNQDFTHYVKHESIDGYCTTSDIATATVAKSVVDQLIPALNTEQTDKSECRVTSC